MKIALFGANGYLGAQLTRFFADAGDSVTGYDLPACDVAESGSWMNIVLSSFDAVVFFAGLTGTERSFTDVSRFVRANESGLLNLLQRLAPMGHKAPFVLFPSSRLVYRSSDQPLSEDDPKEAKTVYAANKIACEAMLQAYSARYGIRYAVVRICVPYGNLVSHEYSYGTLGFFLKQAAEGAITLYGDGSQKRTFTHVRDICEAVRRLVSGGIIGIFNIGGSDLTLAEAAELVARRKSVDVRYLPWPEAAARIESGSTFFDSTRLADAIGLVAYRSFEKFVSEL